MKILIIGKHWPEPQSSAAGSRMMEIISVLRPLGEITFATASGSSEFGADLSQHVFECQQVTLNDASFDEFIKTLGPDAVIFDRFMTEEQFGWRVALNCPQAIRILDTEDLHGLRQARQLAVVQERDFEPSDLTNDVAQREIAAIYRCDLSLIISRVEMEYLTGFFGVPERLLHYLPFLMKDVNRFSSETLPTFEQRIDFVTIGNFLHAPNADAVRYLHSTIWPEIRKQLPDAVVHVYGAYLPEKMKKLHAPENGFLMHGRAEDAALVVKQSRVFLAPLRFGAGLKGKLLLAMQCGTPSVTTPVGAEGMNENGPWSGAIAETPEEMAAASVRLYNHRESWGVAANRGFDIMRENFDLDQFAEGFTGRIREVMDHLKNHRLANFTGRILQHQSMRSTEYMSRWIEEKNRNRKV